MLPTWISVRAFYAGTLVAGMSQRSFLLGGVSTDAHRPRQWRYLSRPLSYTLKL
jgi:hypothetical protein